MSRRYRMEPVELGVELCQLHCRDTRFIKNTALEQFNLWRRGGPQGPGSAERFRQLTDARQAFDWLREGSSAVQQQALRDFDRAVANFWNPQHPARRPTWWKKGLHESFTIRDAKVRVLSGKWAEVLIPKHGAIRAQWVRFRLSRPLPKRVASARVTLDGKGRWHVSFPGVQPAVARVRTGAVVGVDRGVTNTLALTDGRLLHAPVMRKKEQKKLAESQRRKARQRKGSKRRDRTKARIAALHQGVADRRKNWIEVQTTRLVREADLIAVENLKVQNMVRRPRPVPDPDREGVFLPNRAAQKSGLNRSIHQQGWSQWLQRLEAKAVASGVQVVRVPAAHTSDGCRKCGHQAAGNRESQAVFHCQACGHVQHADIHAAENILAQALMLAPTPGQEANQPDGSVGKVARISRPSRGPQRELPPVEVAHAA